MPTGPRPPWIVLFRPRCGRTAASQNKTVTALKSCINPGGKAKKCGDACLCRVIAARGEMMISATGRTRDAAAPSNGSYRPRRGMISAAPPGAGEVQGRPANEKGAPEGAPRRKPVVIETDQQPVGGEKKQLRKSKKSWELMNVSWLKSAFVQLGRRSS